MPKGRPRKAGKRHPNGRLAQPTGWEIMTPVLERRCKQIGLAPTVENMRAVKGQEGGTTWGKLLLSGQIDQRQHDACKWFATLRAAYHRSIDAPKETPKCGDLEGLGGMSAGMDDAEVCRRIRVQYKLAEALLRDCGRQSVLAVMACVREEPMRPGQIGALRVGLSVLAKHFLEGRRAA